MRSPHSLTRLGLLALLGVVLASCGGGAVPRDTYYRLALAQVAARPGGPLHGAAEIAPFRADGLLNARAVLFRSAPNAIEAYSYHFWWQAPGTLIQQSMIDALREANAFDAVAGPEMRLPRDYEIIGRIRRFEQTGPSVVAELELTLRSAQGGPPLLHKIYTEEVASGDETVPSAVAAFSTALGRIWASFVADLANVGS